MRSQQKEAQRVQPNLEKPLITMEADYIEPALLSAWRARRYLFPDLYPWDLRFVIAPLACLVLAVSGLGCAALDAGRALGAAAAYYLCIERGGTRAECLAELIESGAEIPEEVAEDVRGEVAGMMADAAPVAVEVEVRATASGGPSGQPVSCSASVHMARVTVESLSPMDKWKEGAFLSFLHSLRKCPSYFPLRHYVIGNYPNLGSDGLGDGQRWWISDIRKTRGGQGLSLPALGESPALPHETLEACSPSYRWAGALDLCQWSRDVAGLMSTAYPIIEKEARIGTFEGWAPVTLRQVQLEAGSSAVVDRRESLQSQTLGLAICAHVEAGCPPSARSAGERVAGALKAAAGR